MRATRQEGSGEECRVALHLWFAMVRFAMILNFSRNCGGFYLKFEHFSPRIRRCDFSLNEMRSRSAILFSFWSQSQKNCVGRHGRRGLRGGMPCRPPLCFLGRGKSCGSIPPFEPQPSYHNRNVRSGRLPLLQMLMARLRTYPNGFRASHRC